MADLTAWVARLLATEGMATMGHNQRPADLNLGLGWIYYGLARLVRPARAVVIGSYRGFVPAVIAKALVDNAEGGEVTFVDPSLVDDFWKEPARVAGHFATLELDNVRHVLATTQAFVGTDLYRSLGEVGLAFIDGYHTREQAEFDYRALVPKLGPRGVILFHDSMGTRRSNLYGQDAAYEVDVRRFIDELRQDRSLQVFDLPFGTGLTLVRKAAIDEDPLWDGPRRAQR